MELISPGEPVAKFKKGDLIRFRDFDYGIILDYHRSTLNPYDNQYYYDVWWFMEGYREDHEPEGFIDETCSKV